MGWTRDDGPYDFAREIREAREADEHLYSDEERRYGPGAPSRSDVAEEQWKIDHGRR